MTSKAIPKKISIMEYMEMLNGPKVDIYVGSGKKHYCLPKLLLCHYSPYFDRCFNGKFEEGESQTLTLREDRIDQFENLVECVLSDGIPDSLQKETKLHVLFKNYMELLQYAEKYLLGAHVCECIYEPLKSTMIEYMKNGDLPNISPCHIGLIFSATPNGSPIRTFIVQATLSEHGYSNLHNSQRR